MTTTVIPQVCVAELSTPKGGLVGSPVSAAQEILSDLRGCPILDAAFEHDRLTVTFLLPARGAYPVAQWRYPVADLLFWLRVALREQPVVPVRIRSLREATAREMLRHLLSKRTSP